MRIGIIGAGIAGLVAACSLQSNGHEVVVYEQRAAPNVDGAGLTLFGNAFAALDSVGLGDTIRNITHQGLARLTTGQRTPKGRWLAKMPSETVGQLHSVHRVTLHNTLMQLLAPGTVRTGMQALAAADGTPRIHVGYQTVMFDLVVVADGLRSTNRSRLGLDTGIEYSGYTAWRGVTSDPVDIAGTAAETWGQGSIFGYVPLPDERLYWFGTRNQPADTTIDDEVQAVRDTFAGWHAPIQDCLEATKPTELMRHDVYDLAKPLKTFTKSRTVLMGDAAHAMLPNLGQGAGQGIEDAVTLTLLLGAAPPRDLDTILARYSTMRRPRTTRLWRQSRLMAGVAQAAGPVAVRLRNVGLRVTPAGVIGPVTKRLHHWEPPTA